MAVKPDVILSGLFHTPVLAPDVVDICADLNAIAAGAVAPGDMIVAINGGACKLVPFSPTTTHTLTWTEAGNLVSTVNGIVATVTVLPGIIVKNLGYDLAGNVVSQVPAAFALCPALAATVNAATPAIPGTTRLIGQDCLAYVLPDLCSQLTALSSSFPNPAGFRIVGVDTINGICTTAFASNMFCDNLVGLANSGPMVPGVTVLAGYQGTSCSGYTLPTLCAQITALSLGVSAVGDRKVVIDASNACKLVSDNPFDICATLAALPFAGVGLPATELYVGADCKRYSLPSLCDLIPLVGPGVAAAGDEVVVINGGLCKLIPFSFTTTNTLTATPLAGFTSTVNGVAANVPNPVDIIAFNLGYNAAGALVRQAPAAFALCPALAATVNAGAAAVPGTTRLIGQDCLAYVLPTLCTQVAAIAGGAAAAGDQVLAVNAGVCKLIPTISYVKCNASPLLATDPVLVAGLFAGTTPTPNQIMVANGVNCPFTLVAPACAAVTVFSSVSLGSPDPAAGGVPVWVKNRATQNQAILAATGTFDVNVADTLFIDNVAAATITLTTPLGCAPKRFAFKRRVGNAFPVTFTPASGQIEGGANYIFNAPLESGFVEFDGTNWWVI